MMKCKLRMKKNVIPHNYQCQNRMMTLSSDLADGINCRSAYGKRRMIEVVREALAAGGNVMAKCYPFLIFLYR